MSKFYENTGKIVKTNRFLVLGIIFSLLISAGTLLFSYKIWESKDSIERFAFSIDGASFKMSKIIEGKKSDAMIETFVRKANKLIYTQSYKDFNIKVIKAGQSKFITALSLMTRNYAKAYEASIAIDPISDEIKITEEQLITNLQYDYTISDVKIDILDNSYNDWFYKVKVDFKRTYSFKERESAPRKQSNIYSIHSIVYFRLFEFS